MIHMLLLALGVALLCFGGIYFATTLQAAVSPRVSLTTPWAVVRVLVIAACIIAGLALLGVVHS